MAKKLVAGDLATWIDKDYVGIVVLSDDAIFQSKALPPKPDFPAPSCADNSDRPGGLGPPGAPYPR